MERNAETRTLVGGFASVAEAQAYADSHALMAGMSSTLPEELRALADCLRACLDEGALDPRRGGDCVIIDGYVDLGPERPGLGRVLFEALDADSLRNGEPMVSRPRLERAALELLAVTP